MYTLCSACENSIVVLDSAHRPPYIVKFKQETESWLEGDFKHRGQIIFQDSIFPLELCPIGCCSHLLHINHYRGYCTALYEAKWFFYCLFSPFLNMGAPGDLSPRVYKLNAAVRWGFDNLSRQMWRGMVAKGAKVSGRNRGRGGDKRGWRVAGWRGAMRAHSSEVTATHTQEAEHWEHFSNWGMWLWRSWDDDLTPSGWSWWTGR